MFLPSIDLDILFGSEYLSAFGGPGLGLDMGWGGGGGGAKLWQPVLKLLRGNFQVV